MVSLLIIDEDASAARELAGWLLERPRAPRLFMSAYVRDAEETLRTETIDWLFIRITAWDDYQRLAPHLPGRPSRVVFLSGRSEKCTQSLNFELDAHLQPPYHPARLTRTWNQLTDPRFMQRPTDFFFLKSQARFHPVRYADLKEVRCRRRLIYVRTRHAEFSLAGSLAQFRGRLPIPLAYVKPGWLVNEAYIAGL